MLLHVMLRCLIYGSQYEYKYNTKIYIIVPSRLKLTKGYVKF